jgi:methyl-accepting chemotaxis protein
MFFSSGKISSLEDTIRKRDLDIESLNKQIRMLQDENASLKNQNQSLEIESKNNRQNIEEYQKKLEKLNSSFNKEENADNKRIEQLFTSENQNLKTGLLDIQKNIAESTDIAKASLDKINDVSEIRNTSLNDLNKIMSSLSGLNTDSKEIGHTVDDLYTKAKNIGDALSMINEIVLQINILSLNASVEAASAGEAGKGFAVVASEVKNLATKTSEVAKHIEVIVKDIQDNVKTTNQKFDLIIETIDKLLNTTDKFNTDISNVYSATEDSFGNISHMTDRIFMSLAKLDHVIWKVNTYLSVAERKEVFKFVNHHNCRLGKWYNEGDGKEYFAKTKSYKALEKPHSIVHNGTHKVFDAIKNDKVDFNKVVLAFAEMERASQDVFLILDKILHEKD